MRDPSRIKQFCDRLAAVWEQQPDLRFSQLLTCVLGDGVDRFYVEDDDMLALFESFDSRQVDPEVSYPLAKKLRELQSKMLEKVVKSTEDGNMDYRAAEALGAALVLIDYIVSTGYEEEIPC